MKCIALLACEKVIIDKDGAHSLINVMQSAQIKLQEQHEGKPKDIEVPSNAVMPFGWWIFSCWEPSQEDVGKSFDQVYQIYWPNGEKVTDSRLKFTQPNERQQQTTTLIAGFPAGQPGKVRFVTWLEATDGRRVTEVVESFVTVEHAPPGVSLRGLVATN